MVQIASLISRYTLSGNGEQLKRARRALRVLLCKILPPLPARRRLLASEPGVSRPAALDAAERGEKAT